jgi:hypothetical protein
LPYSQVLGEIITSIPDAKSLGISTYHTCRRPNYAAQVNSQKPKRLLRNVSLALIGLSLLLGGFSVVGGIVSFVNAFQAAMEADIYTTPVSRTITLEAGKYSILESTAQRSQSGEESITREQPVELSPEDVVLTNSAGESIAVKSDNVTETIDRGNESFESFARFEILTDGEYQLQVNGVDQERVMLNPSLGGLAWPIVAGIGSFLCMVIGVICLIGWLLTRRRVPQATSVAGWYPDPQNPGQQRYWDGQQWQHPAS